MLSSNFCEALTQFYDETLENSLDVSFDWSAKEPVGEQDRLTRPLRFQRDYSGRIEEVRRELRASEGHAKDTYIGTVERLNGERQAGRRSDIGPAATGRRNRPRPRGPDRRAICGRRPGAHDRRHVCAGKLQPGRQPEQLSEITRFGLILCPRTPRLEAPSGPWLRPDKLPIHPCHGLTAHRRG
ncbi:hypothetical protein [Methylomagnum sp.]